MRDNTTTIKKFLNKLCTPVRIQDSEHHQAS